MEKELAEHNMRNMEGMLRSKGFDDDVIAAMREKVSAGKGTEFNIPYESKVDGKRFSGQVHFEGNPGGPYVPDHYTLDLGKDSGRPLRENAFYFTVGYDVNLREGFNLMQGRAVYREPLFDRDHHGYWITLKDERIAQGVVDLSYDHAVRTVEHGIAASSLKGLLLPEIKKQLAEALKQGDRTMLTVETMGLTKQVWVEMDPLREGLKLTDQKGKVVGLAELGLERGMEAVVEKRRGLRR